MIYTMEQWGKDREFKAKEGQEISEEIYNEMLNVLPPKTLPQEKAHEALTKLNIPVHGGFLMGEPHSSNKNGQQLYMAFGMNDFASGTQSNKRYYYLGLSTAKKKLNGVYYYFECMNAFLEKPIKASEFKDDKEAITFGANYEATIYKQEWKNDELVSNKVIYDPWRSFDE